MNAEIICRYLPDMFTLYLYLLERTAFPKTKIEQPDIPKEMLGFFSFLMLYKLQMVEEDLKIGKEKKFPLAPKLTWTPEKLERLKKESKELGLI